MNTRTLFKSFITVVVIVGVLLSLLGCGKYLYGVPEEEWKKLSDDQRLATISGYNERERLREQTRASEAARRNLELAQKAEAERHRQELERRRIEAIYAGEAGNLGDLIRVSLQGGDMLIGGRRRPFHPLTMRLASGESRRIEVMSNDDTYSSRVDIILSYRDGLLLIDEAEFRPDLAVRLVYDSAWKKGGSYIINSRGNRELRNVRVNVEVIPHLRRYH